MALTVPIPLGLGRFKQLPQRSQEVWQGGLVRLPTWIAHPTDPDGEPYRPTGAVWVSIRTGLIHLALPTEATAASPEFALASLLEFGLKRAKGLEGRPGRIEVSDPSLRDVLATALADTSVVMVDRLQAVREVLAQFEEDTSGGQRHPGLLDSPAITPDRLRAFAGAAASFYTARVWDHLANEDLIEIEGGDVPKGMRHMTVLGQGGSQFGLAFFDSRAAFEQVLELANAGRHPDRVHGVTFGPVDELPFADVDAWLDHRLPVAGPRAYPLAAELRRDGIMRRPDARGLTFAEALLRALGATTEDEIDTGRWQKQVETHDGTTTVTMTLPLLLEAEAGHASTALRVAAMPRAVERSSARLARLLETKSFASLDDANAEIAKAEQAGLFEASAEASAGRELTPLERAQELAYEAMEAPGRLQVKRARQALAISPDCADAWVMLAEAASTPEVAMERYSLGTEAGARAIGTDRFESINGEFWSHLETRPYMRARLGLARTLEALGRADEAVAHYRELLRLNPGDNQGVRYLLIVTLLELHRDDEAGALLGDHEDDIQGLWPFARVLWRFRREGDTAASRAALADAAVVNPHAIEYLLDIGAATVPRLPYFALGSREEAAYVAEELGDLYEAAPGLLDWLRSQAPRLRKRPAKARKRRRNPRQVKG